jgi:YegS/Rv2252/BmrU family lipid kinase
MSAQLRTFVIANPISGSGLVEKEWDVVERQLRSTLTEYNVAFTEGPGHATLLAREALRAGWEMVVSVGGDGTLNEVTNGFLERVDYADLYDVEPGGWLNRTGDAPTLINPDAVLGVIPMGTGGDFRRTLGMMGGWREAVEALAGTKTRKIDLGMLAFLDDTNRVDGRVFVNIASMGLSGAVDDLVGKIPAQVGGSAQYTLAVLGAFVRWKNVSVDFRFDEIDELREDLVVAIVANGQFFGGGMWAAPGAAIDDGQFQFVMLGDLTRPEAVRTLIDIYRGNHFNSQKVWRRNARSITARAVDPHERVLLDVDGEALGRLPAALDVLPGFVNLKV